jgi:hypothetical protein
MSLMDVAIKLLQMVPLKGRTNNENDIVKYHHHHLHLYSKKNRSPRNYEMGGKPQ